ncbi:hypothetical protein EIN_416720 [Entamoeba invadens IP1]|uniref:Uncharacterized protein n=1 Tax=Entamoeba invadens IP1 TaxID=370355 RepID=A0A0A1TUE1_ENTIV|nr:hypothetical protein EIN_416720 [Entamoeba invadens IP1]ELP83613.1 hypothetical protein EIN_416720 [Entamoeba invadens IP1]|eukprot:XP_004182959.1 hypothetical protein EIN_416720 [Entamoeba invadens IP1]
MKSFVNKIREIQCPNAPIIILWSTMILVEILMMSIVVLIAQTGCSDLDEINDRFDPDLAPSFIVGPRDFLYGDFNGDLRANRLIADVLRVGVFSKICDTANDTVTFDFISNITGINNLNYESYFNASFTFEQGKLQKFCNSVRDYKRCVLSDKTEYITFSVNKKSVRSVTSIVEAKKILNKTRVPLVFHFPDIPQVVYLNKKDFSAGIVTPARDPYGTYSATSQYIAFSGREKINTGIIVGWNDNVMVSYLDGNYSKGGFIIRNTNESAPRHSVDWWVGDVSLDVEVNRCFNNDSYTLWRCYASGVSQKSKATIMKLRQEVITEQTLEGLRVSNIEVEYRINPLDEPDNVTTFTFYEMVSQIQNGTFAGFSSNFNFDTFVVFPLCKTEDSQNEGQLFDIVQQEGGFFDIKMSINGDEEIFILKHVWKEFMETYFVRTEITLDLDENYVPPVRAECAYSFLPYDVVKRYMQLNPFETHFHQFDIEDLECGGKEMEIEIDETVDLNITMKAVERNFTLLQNNIAYYKFPIVSKEKTNNLKDEL